MWRLMIGLIAFGLVAGTPAAGLPPAFKAEYVVKKGPFELGRSTRELRYGKDGELVFRSDSDSTGVVGLLFSEQIRETTRMRQVDGRAVPIEYQYRRDGRRDRVITQQFDWEKGQVISQVDAMRYEFPLPPGANDQNGYQVNLMIDLAKGLRNISYQVARKNDMREYEIRHVRDERLDTVLGKLDTVVIQRKSDKTTTMWCAPDLHYLPVKIQHEEDGSVFSAYLQSLDGLRLPAARDAVVLSE